MCGILVSNILLDREPQAYAAVKQRGPDLHNYVSWGGYHFLHALLSLTGDFTPQPVVDDEYAVIFNGEIYNFKDLGNYASEAHALIDLYRHCGERFFQNLDGEFVIIVIDKRRSEIIVATDCFGTKPIWFGGDKEGRFALSSLKSGITELGLVDTMEFPPNSLTAISLVNLKITRRFNLRTFDLEQGSGTLDRWCELFDESVRKRLKVDNHSEPIFVGLSSGYDSGAITASLKKTKTKFVALSIYNDQILEDLLRRTMYLSGFADHCYLRDRRPLSACSDIVELLNYRIFSLDGSYMENGTSTHTDSGAQGLFEICKQAHKSDLRVYLSGSGADEIYSDYGAGGKKIFRHSNFGGLFPKDLRTIFPWPSFFGSSMRAYLMKEEYVAGAFGIEGRYPFLDFDLVQEFLALPSKVKNTYYKSPIHYYLKQNGYPFNENEKYGF
jgi:asparagine synthetase B (glutamine-hydrolysing)